MERAGDRVTLVPGRLRVEGHRLLLAVAGWVLSSVAIGFVTSNFLPRLLPA